MESIDLAALADRAAESIFAALAHDDWALASSRALDEWGPLMAFRPEAVALVCEMIPSDIAAEQPEWLVLRAELRQMQTRPELRSATYADTAPLPSPEDSSLSRAFLTLSRARAARSEGRHDRSSQLAFEAERAMRVAQDATLAAAPLLVPFLLQSALTHELAWLPEHAVRLFGEAHRRSTANRDIVGAIIASGELGLILALAGDGLAADNWLEEHGALLSRYDAAPWMGFNGHLGRALRHWDTFEFEAAARELARIDPAAAWEHSLILSAVEVLVGARVADDHGGALLSRFDTELVAVPEGRRGPFGLNARLATIIRMEVLSLRGDAAAALRAVADVDLDDAPMVAARVAAAQLLVDDEEAADRTAAAVMRDGVLWPRAAAEAALVRAAIALRRGERDRALDLTRSVIAGMRAHRSFMPLAALSGEDCAALAALLPDDERPRGLDAVIGGTISLPPAHQRRARPTPSELRVLRAIDDSSDEETLADALGIARSTLRTQLHSLYRKFDVSTRGALRTAARRAGFL